MALGADLGLELSVRLHADASAAFGIVQRQGSGKLRHIDVGILWLQQKELQKRVNVRKVSGVDNPADMFTKHLARHDMDRHLKELRFSRRAGRGDLAVEVHG